MAKPSIFSREYKRKMRERRRKVGMFIVILIAAAGVLMSSGYVKGWFEKGISSVKNSKNDAKSLLTGKNNDQKVEDKKAEENKENAAVDNKVNENTQTKPQENVVVAEKFLQVTLPDNKVIKIVYEEVADGKKLKNIKDESNLYYNISPNAKNLVVFDAPTQKMMLINSEGAVKDITKPSYTTKDKSFTATRESQLAKRPNYIWCSTPKFINDDTIAYITNLPVLNKFDQYIWAYNMQKDDHEQIYAKVAKAITFKEFSEGKLAIDIDGAPKYILPDGNITD